MINETEFLRRLSEYEGIEIQGDIIQGIRLLTDAERAQRIQNSDTIRFAICDVCGADERSCSSNCALIKGRLAERIAAMCPLDANLRDIRIRMSEKIAQKPTPENSEKKGS